MYADEKKINVLFHKWLNISLLLVFIIIIVGGLTRLTNSGLSITEWELFDGILPPLNDKSWQIYFDEYKKIPQYKFLNFNMSLDEFKIIFYWEYFHRILARIVGIFFLVPLIFFYFSNKIDKKLINNCIIIFILIFFQGIIGWFMVKSGLVNNTTVSHYRLAVHLTTAFIIISSIFWVKKNFITKKLKFFYKVSKHNLPFQILILLIFAQIIMGAFVSGLDAGKIYQTWPMMGDSYLPNDLKYTKISNILEFNNHSLVQFYHRNLAYVIILYVLSLSVFIYRNKILNLFRPLKKLILILSLQVILGIFTLISGLNIFLASLHQITSILLILSALNLYYFRAK